MFTRKSIASVNGYVYSMTNSLSRKIAFTFYALGWSLAIPLLRRNRRLKEGFDQRILRVKPQRADLWIQAASVGESLLAWELIKHFQPPGPVRILMTSNTSQGMDVLEKARRWAKRENIDVIVKTAYFPFDHPKIMQQALTEIRPKVLLMLESELWPGLMAACKKQRVKMLVVNGRINPKSLKRYQIWPSLWQDLRPDRVLAISETDALRFGVLFGNDVVETMPNIKFDRVNEKGLTADRVNPLTSVIGPDERLVVLGSVRQEEEKDIARLIGDMMAKAPRLIIGLFPRHMHRLNHWRKILGDLNLPWLLRSEINGHVNSGTVVLWDTMGELSPAYELAQTAFVGGSLAPVGGQNFLEPLTCGLKPVIGPYWSNFFWIGREIIDQKLVIQVNNWQELSEVLLKKLSQPLQREQTKDAVIDYVRNRQGGTGQACKVIVDFLQK